MTIPGLREWIFSLKTFAAAMAAFYIALSIDLDRPYWSIATVYIVSQPLSGAMRSKGVYRLCGTLLGASAAIVMVPNLVDAPVLLSAALALWLGVCLYFSLCDRTPRSYVFMLAGYTAAIIGFPSVDQPDLIFETAGARIEEIGLGIICATVIGSTVFPRSVVPVLQERIDTGLTAARRWALAVLAGQRGEMEALAARQTIASASGEIRMLIVYLSHEASDRQGTARLFEVLAAKMTYLLPVLSGVSNRVAALRAADGITAEIQVLLDRFAAWLHSGPEGTPETGRRLRADLAGAMPATGADWPTILRSALLARLAEYVDLQQDIGALRRQVRSGTVHVPPLELARGIGPDATRNHDRAMALLSGFAAALAISLLCAFWIAAEWPDGAIAVLMAAILCSFFATLDDPVPEILRFLRDVVVAFFIAAIYLFLVLPQIEGFAVLIVVLAPAYLVLGALMAVPATFLRSMSIVLNTTMMLTLTDAYSADFATFLNSGLASGFGIAVAAAVTALVRSVGVSVTARRLEGACRRDVAHAASRRGAVQRPMFAAVLLDRLADLMPRLAAADSDLRMQRVLRDLGVGQSVVDLQRDCAALPPGARESVQQTLVEVGVHYARPLSDSPVPALLARIDHTIAVVAETGARSAQTLLMELLAIRQGIFPGASIPDVPIAKATG